VRWRGARYEGEFPTLGHQVIEWMTASLATPDVGEHLPFVPTDEQAAFLLRFYATDEMGRRFRFRRAVYSRMRGAGKSPLVAAVAAAEALAPCVVPDGFDARGEPAGRPWSSLRTPLVQLAAVSESQTRNAWAPLLEMLSAGPIIDTPGLEVMSTFVVLPAGRIEPITAAALSHIGNPACFVACDQTESWTPSNGGVRLFETLSVNVGKRGGRLVETPNAYIPGEDSVAQRSAEYWQSVVEGRASDSGILYDHREAGPIVELSDLGLLRDRILEAQGDAAAEHGGWQDTDRVLAECLDPAISAQAARRWYLNQVTHASDAWISKPEWTACATEHRVTPGARITLGFDGSRHREDAMADATALVGCTLEGHVFEIAVWEPTPDDRSWWVPEREVEEVVEATFDRYDVVGFYCDPSHWRDQVTRWEQRYGSKLRVSASGPHPAMWPTSSGARMATALEEFESAVRGRRLHHNNDPTLSRHILNARRRPRPTGMQIAKEHPRSDRKIDGAIAAVLAWEARRDALSAGLDQPPATAMFVPFRIR
jgi:hypothetical protein